MPAIETVEGRPEPAWMRSRVYAGDLLLVRGMAAAERLVEHFRGVVEARFGSDDPTTAQQRMSSQAWQREARELRAAGKKDPVARELMTALFAAVDLPPERTAADVVNLRCQPHSDSPGPDARHTLGAHRDTWASNVYQQINWWLPVYPISPRRTITFFPFYWDQPIANDSADWDLAAIRAEVRAARAAQREPSIRNTPEPTASILPAHSLPVVVQPGELLLFSGAHLHASVPNDSGRARFSLELRSVDREDFQRGVGAPNVDGDAPHAGLHWFRGLHDNQPLGPAVAT